jgi:hypothetical protein
MALKKKRWTWVTHNVQKPTTVNELRKVEQAVNWYLSNSFAVPQLLRKKLELVR